MQFLERLHELGVTIATGDREQHYSLQSLFRYHSLWLPLVHKHSNEDLIPPPDVAWLWHCHRLSPLNYTNFIRSTFGDGAAVEAKPSFAFQTPKITCDDSSTEATTRDFWNSTYPNEPFFVSEINKDESPLLPYEVLPNRIRGENAKLLSGFNLLASTKRQATFLWQISGERYRDDDFLAEGVENYIKFLKLKPKAGKLRTVLVPTYQIDLMWHTHILSSIGDYNKDCIALMGRTLHHDDSLTDRSDGGVLDVAYKATAHLWKEEYHSEYEVCGGMYRGEPPKDFFSRDWKSTSDVSTGANLHLVGLMGASSTPPPEKWIKPGESASDGQPAFIPVTVSPLIGWDRFPRKEDYVLGETKYGNGYYHLETQEAHQLLRTRVETHIRQFEYQIAMAQGCCPRQSKRLQALEDEMQVFIDARNFLSSRVAAAHPGVGRNIPSPFFWEVDGAMLYSPVLFYCAGGACGGILTCEIPPRAAGHGGGGCGGGGCGGGGCGGCGGCGG
ncbi:glycine-rich protein [Fragilaria crotonensis]|nr:glycine-rich protein [Fragilaria crotonensis]